MRNIPSWPCSLLLALAFTAQSADRAVRSLGPGQELVPAVSGSGAIGDRFGRTLAWDGNTLAVGAIGDETTAADRPGGVSSGTVSIYVDTPAGLVLEAQLSPSDSSGDDRFGFALALSGDLLSVGAPFEAVDAQGDRGAVYVFRRAGATWEQVARLVAPDGAGGDAFGYALDLDASALVVGAPRALGGRGKAYRYGHDGTAFTLAGTLAGSDAGGEAGRSIALGDDAIYVGAPMADSGATDAGEVHCHARAGGACDASVLVAAAAVAGANFGASLAEQAGRLVVGAPGESVGGHARQGAVYVLGVRANGNATLRDRLVAADGAADDAFGSALAFDAGTIAVGAPGALGAEGAAYVWLEAGGRYNLQQPFSEPDGGLLDLFGASVALKADRLAIGVELDSIGPNRGQGSVAVFRRAAGVWSETERLARGDGASREQFGGAVALHDGLAIVGSAFDDPALDQDDAGSATIFRREPGGWVRDARIVAPDLFTEDLFGFAVDIGRVHAIVGAPRAIVGGRIDQGVAHVFRRESGTWIPDAKLVSPAGREMEFFGAAVAIDGDTALVGAPFENSAGLEAGAGYVFRRGVQGWALESRLASPGFSELGVAGLAVALDGDVALLGAPDSTIGEARFAGVVQVFERSGTSWRHAGTVAAPDGSQGDAFGSSVSLDSDEMIVGAAQDAEATFAAAGAAYVFTRGAAGAWTFVRRVVSPQPSRNAFFGASVSISDGRALVGSIGFDGSAPNTGAAFLFERGGGTWPLAQSLAANSPQGGALFGNSVALGPVAALVGEPLRDRVNPDEGAAYAFPDDDRLFRDSFE